MADIIYPLIPNAGQADVPKIKYHDNGDGSQSATVYVQNSTGGSGSSLSDVLLTDSNGILFVGRDTGATTGTIFTYYRLDTQAAYTPVGTIKAAGNNVVTEADGANVALGAIADAAVVAGAAGTANAHLRSISRDIGTVAANIPTVGQKASAASQPVVIANDQSPVTVTGSVSTTAVADLTATGTVNTQNLNATGTATAGSAVALTLNGTATVGMVIATNTLTAALSTQVSIDGTNWVGANVFTAGGTVAGNGGTSTIASGATGSYAYMVAGYKLFRIVAQSATTGSASIQLNGSSAPGIGTQSVNLSTINNAQGLNIASLSNPGGSAGISLLVGAVAPTTASDVSSQSWAAASGSSSTVTDLAGAACSYDVNLIAFTAGASTGLDVFLQWSPDNGTTWYDLWQCEALTAVGHAYIPAIMMPGARRRMRWVNRGGAATTATVTVTSNRLSIAPSTIQRQWFDRTAGVLAGTTSTFTAWYDVAGCKNISAYIPVGTATGAATYQLQLSADGVNALPGGAAVQAGASTTTAYTNVATGATARFARLAVTSAATSQTAATTPIVITGC